MKIKPLRKAGYQLLHEGSIELSRVEANGIRIDTERLARTKVELKEKAAVLQRECERNEVWKCWKRRFGERASLTSMDQLAAILHGEMGFPILTTTDKGRPAMDEEALQKINHPFVKPLARFLKYKKALGTFLKGIEFETVAGRLHPVFNLHLVVSFRSSSDTPNFQNFPVRDKEIAQIIRTLFIASEGCVLVENDFKGIEVALSASYHRDPVFIDYITTPGKDMHRDMASQIYMVAPNEVSKDARYGAKNKCVFPFFYGDWYKSCAPQLWEWAEKGKLLGPNGLPMQEWLQVKGITGLGACDMELDPVPGTFEHHMQQVEKDFWENRFMVYGQWRKDFYKAYVDKGYFDILTGFRVYGAFNRKQCTNFPIQGSAFHCLLWSLIQINKRLRKYKMKSRVVGQIHDSMLGDVRTNELTNYMEIVQEVTEKGLPKQYPWLAVPPEIECEISPRTASWFDKTETKFKDGRFQHPSKPGRFTSDPEKFLTALDKFKTKT